MNEYLKFYKKLPLFKSLIYLDYFEDFQKRSLFYDLENEDNETILENCVQKYPKCDCYIEQFFSDTEYDERLRFGQNVTINLFFLQIRSGSILKLNLFQIICFLVILFTLLTGLNWPKISHFAVFIINFLFRPEEKLNFKNLIFFVSLLGFVLHSYLIFTETMLSSLEISTEYNFNYLSYNKVTPTVVFCLKMKNLTFEKGEVPTGNLLEEKTKNLNESYLFDQIIFFDQNADKRFWKPNDEQSSNFKIEFFFLLNYKCYQIVYQMNHEHVRNYIISTILEIRFNRNITHKNYLFITKLDHTDDFSNNFRLNFRKNYRVYYNRFYNVHHNRYQTLMNPKLWFGTGYKINDVALYMNQIREEFKANFNFSTTLMPLTKEYFNLSINDDAFNEFNLNHVKRRESEGLLDLNYERSLFETIIYPSRTNETSSITFDKTFYSVESKFRKNEKLIINVLMMTYFWFDLYITNLPHLCYQLFSFLSIFRYAIIKRRILKIKRKIDSYFIDKRRSIPIFRN